MPDSTKVLPQTHQAANKLICRKEAQFILGVGGTTFFKWLKEERFPVVRLSRRCIRFWLHDILAFAQENLKRGLK